MGRLSGKNAVIIGGGTGVGLATAQLLTPEGARVLLTGCTQQTLDSAAEKLGSGAIVVRSDAALSGSRPL